MTARVTASVPSASPNSAVRRPPDAKAASIDA